jgi:multicomponent Na+:H+ antiporter subunit E
MKTWWYQRFFKRWHFFVAMYTLWMLFNFQWDLWTWSLGAIISVLMTLFTSFVLYDETKFKSHMLSPLQLIAYFLNLLKEIMVAAFVYIRLIFKGDYEVVVFDMTLSFDDPIKTALVANSITLTPGTVSVDVNGSTLTVMAMVKKGTPISMIEEPIHRQFEARLKGMKR